MHESLESVLDSLTRAVPLTLNLKQGCLPCFGCGQCCRRIRQHNKVCCVSPAMRVQVLNCLENKQQNPWTSDDVRRFAAKAAENGLAVYKQVVVAPLLFQGSGPATQWIIRVPFKECQVWAPVNTSCCACIRIPHSWARSRPAPAPGSAPLPSGWTSRFQRTTRACPGRRCPGLWCW